MQKIKIIWDFRGDDALKIAEHHAVHVKEFCEKEKIMFHQIDAEQKSEIYAIAFVTVDKSNITLIRDVLKPHRAEMS
tara:strand:- start:426 stop:656 length:231 start_codon:yes stop_codon:yes gene_type:complete